MRYQVWVWGALFAMPGVWAAAQETGGSRAHLAESNHDHSEAGWSGEATFDFFSHYIDSGQILTDDPVFQPGAALEYNTGRLGRWGALVWGSMDLTDVNDNEGEFNEVNLSLFYGYDIGPVGVEIGGIYYEFPNTGEPDTTELYVAVGTEFELTEELAFAPSVTGTYDIDAVDALYADLEAALSYAPEALQGDGVGLALELGTALGIGGSQWNEATYGDDAGFNYWDLGLAAPLSLGEHITVTPSVTHALLIADKGADHDDSNVWYGLSLGFAY